MKLLTNLMILCALSACGSQTTYRPSILGHDYKNMEMVKPDRQGRIYCGDEEFNKYASVALKDIAKLALILKEAKVPKKVRVLVEGFGKEVRYHLNEQKKNDIDIYQVTPHTKP